MLLIYGSIINLKIKLVIAFKIWIGNGIQSLNFGSLIQSCQIGVLVQSIHNCGTLAKTVKIYKRTDGKKVYSQSENFKRVQFSI